MRVKAVSGLPYWFIDRQQPTLSGHLAASKTAVPPFANVMRWPAAQTTGSDKNPISEVIRGCWSGAERAVQRRGAHGDLQLHWRNYSAPLPAQRKLSEGAASHGRKRASRLTDEHSMARWRTARPPARLF